MTARARETLAKPSPKPRETLGPRHRYQVRARWRGADVALTIRARTPEGAALGAARALGLSPTSASLEGDRWHVDVGGAVVIVTIIS